MGFKKRNSAQSDDSVFSFDFDTVQDDSFVNRTRKNRPVKFSFFDEEEPTDKEELFDSEEECEYCQVDDEELDEDTPLEELPPEEDTYVEEDDTAIIRRRRLKRGLALFASFLILAVATIPTIVNYYKSKQPDAFFEPTVVNIVYPPNTPATTTQASYDLTVSEYDHYVKIIVSSNKYISEVTLNVYFYDENNSVLASKNYSASSSYTYSNSFTLVLYYGTSSTIISGVNLHTDYMQGLDPSKIARIDASIVSISFNEINITSGFDYIIQ